MRFLIDGDVYVYHACHASQREVVFDRTATRTTDLDELRSRLENTVVAHMTRVHKTLGLKRRAEVIVALSGVRSENWRRKVLTTYKGNRKPELRPLGFDYALQILRERFKVQEYENLEADDVLGIRATEVKDAVIFTTDKDLLQIPRMVARPASLGPGGGDDPTEVELIRVTEQEADRWHMTQALTGDSVDNYTGLPGVGPKSADKILDAVVPWDTEKAWDAVVAAYEKKGLTEQDALVQARVARMLRTGEYDFKTRTVRLWTPTHKTPIILPKKDDR